MFNDSFNFFNGRFQAPLRYMEVMAGGKNFKHDASNAKLLNLNKWNCLKKKDFETIHLEILAFIDES